MAPVREGAAEPGRISEYATKRSRPRWTWPPTTLACSSRAPPRSGSTQV